MADEPSRSTGSNRVTRRQFRRLRRDAASTGSAADTAELLVTARTVDDARPTQRDEAVPEEASPSEHEPDMRRGYGGSALAFAISALIGSCFVGWFFPVALLGIVLGIIAIRKRSESTQLGVWSIGLGIVALAYSVLWIWWAGQRLAWW